MLSALYTSKWFWIIGVPVCIVIIAVFGSLYWTVSRYDNLDSLPQSAPKTAIVLGAALWENEPSPALKERLLRAKELIDEGKVERLILSGGLGSRDQLTEAEAMRRFLVSKGVPNERILLETESHNTFANIQNSAKLLDGSNEVILVTHDYHMYRALQIAKELQLTAVPYPAHSQVLFGPYHKLRETLAIMKYYITGEIK